MATKTARYLQQLRRERLPPIPSVRELVKIYQLTAIKQLSQNFLMDFKLTSKIVKAAGNVSDCVVCEVGPGPGGITRSILEQSPKQIILIEKDKRFDRTLGLLQDACPGKIDIYWGDVLSFQMGNMISQDFAKHWEDTLPKIHVIGNLPFSIATPLISRWLGQMSARENVWSYGRVPLTLTFQKEVAERLTAEVSSEQRSRLSIMAQHLTYCSLKFIIKGTAFVPKPDVDVGVVKFVPRKEPLIKQPFPLVEKVVRQTFCMRGKYSCKPISTLFPKMVRLQFTKMLFEDSLVFPNTRPYDLSMEEFQRICDAYAGIISRYPEIGIYNYRGVRADRSWEEKYGSKFEPFRTEKGDLMKSAAQMKPLDVVSKHLALECENEIIAEQDNEDYVFIR